jgi:hypothetical protein
MAPKQPRVPNGEAYVVCGELGPDSRIGDSSDSCAQLTSTKSDPIVSQKFENNATILYKPLDLHIENTQNRFVRLVVDFGSIGPRYGCA